MIERKCLPDRRTHHISIWRHTRLSPLSVCLKYRLHNMCFLGTCTSPAYFIMFMFNRFTIEIIDTYNNTRFDFQSKQSTIHQTHCPTDIVPCSF